MPLSMLTNLRIPEMKKNPYVNDQFEISGMTLTLKFSGSHLKDPTVKGERSICQAQIFSILQSC